MQSETSTQQTQQAAPRTECLSAVPVTGTTITKYDTHLCRKRPGHAEKHRCWCCQKTC